MQICFLYFCVGSLITGQVNTAKYPAKDEVSPCTGYTWQGTSVTVGWPGVYALRLCREFRVCVRKTILPRLTPNEVTSFVYVTEFDHISATKTLESLEKNLPYSINS
jgi:hypothetical protein